MSELFLKIVNMSISASWLVLAVLILRLVLKKAPKWVRVLLWGIVAVRLLCPFSLESAWSLIPSAETFPEKVISGPSFDVQTGIPPVDDRINDYLGDRYFEGVTVPVNHGYSIVTILTVIWIVGILFFLAFAVISYLRLRRKIDTAVRYKDNIFQSENVTSPFVLGIAAPKIYLPFHTDCQDLKYVVAHEQAHICRKDHWWKPLGFLLLAIHWLNPLLWLAYVLLCRDIELACDEKVIKDLDNGQRADYTQALVACSVNRRMVAACPLAFGEVGVTERVKSVMNYKKPAFWVIVLSVIACAVVAICFLTNPVTNPMTNPVTNPTTLSVYDIFSEDGYSVIGQEETDISLHVDKSKLPDSIYTYSIEGHEFDPNEIIVFSTETTEIYLRNAMVSHESDDLMYLIFDFSYDLPESGSFVSPYKLTDEKHDGMQHNLHLRSKDLRDESTVFPDALATRGYGSGSQFAFYVSKEACKAAKGTLIIDIVCNKIEYAPQ